MNYMDAAMAEVICDECYAIDLVGLADLYIKGDYEAIGYRLMMALEKNTNESRKEWENQIREELKQERIELERDSRIDDKRG